MASRANVLLLVVTLPLAGCGSSGPESATAPTECELVRDRAIDQRLAALSIDGLDEKTIAAHRAQLRAAVGAELIDACERRSPAREPPCLRVPHDRGLARFSPCATISSEGGE